MMNLPIGHPTRRNWSLDYKLFMQQWQYISIYEFKQDRMMKFTHCDKKNSRLPNLSINGCSTYLYVFFLWYLLFFIVVAKFGTNQSYMFLRFPRTNPRRSCEVYFLNFRLSSFFFQVLRDLFLGRCKSAWEFGIQKKKHIKIWYDSQWNSADKMRIDEHQI